YTTGGSTTWDDDPMRLWHNDGVGADGRVTFRDVANAAGVTDTRSGKGLLTFDFDNDGDLDIFVANNGSGPSLYLNDGGNTNPWLRIKLIGGATPQMGGIGIGSNRDAVGAFLTLTDVLI